MKKQIPISKKLFIEIINLLKKQEEKDHKFADFMENYLDGRFVPMMNEDAFSACIKLLVSIFEGEKTLKEKEGSLIEWWIYEKDYGKNKRINLRVCGKEVELNSAGQLYDFLITDQHENDNSLDF